MLGYDPKRPLDAFGALEHGHDRVVDLGRVNGRWYTCVTASGFDAEANRWANTVHRLSGTDALRRGGVADARRVQTAPVPAHRRRRDRTKCRAWLVAVGNGPAYGGGMNIAPDARLDDGLLDVTVVGEMTKPEILVNFPKVFKGTHVATPEGAARSAATRVELESLDPSVPMDVYADGERVGPLPATMEAVRDALERARCPRAPRLHAGAGLPASFTAWSSVTVGPVTWIDALHARGLVAGDRAEERVLARRAEERHADLRRPAAVSRPVPRQSVSDWWK